MKVVCIADLHGVFDGLEGVKDYMKASGINTLLLLGDYSADFRNEARNKSDVEMVLDELAEGARVYAIPGNCDHPSVVGLFEGRKVSMHEKVVVLDGVSFIGLGGSNPSPFGTPMEYAEEDIYRKLDSLFSTAETEKKVLAVHFPPKDTECDIVPGVGHVGSGSLRRVIEERQPDACICSHIHECAGKTDYIGPTRVLNVGPFGSGNIALVDTSDASVSPEIL
jgi:hypothetical protein